MYIEKNYNELKKKIMNTFELESNVKCVYYYYENRRICVKTEEDYEIMLLSLMNQNLIRLYF